MARNNARFGSSAAARSLRRTTHLAAGILVIGLTGSSAHSQPSPADIYKKYSPSIGTFKWLGFPSVEVVATGTAFFLSPTEIVTNVHVAAGQFGGAIPILEMDDDTAYMLLFSDVVWFSIEDDLVVIRLSPTPTPWPTFVEVRPYPPPVPVTRETPAVASDVVVIGSPMGLHGTITDGIVSAIRTSTTGASNVQISAPVSPGSSGSPVFDEAGRAFGVATWRVVDGENLNFAVPLTLIPDERPESGLTLGEWAKATITKAESERVSGLYQQSYDEVTGGLQTLIDRAEGADRVMAFGGFSVAVKELRTLLASIEDCVPDRLEPGEASAVLSSNWLRAAVILTGFLSEASVSTLAYQRAILAAAVGSSDRCQLKWMSSFSDDFDMLRSAAKELPTDEYVRWSFAQKLATLSTAQCNVYVRNQAQGLDKGRIPVSLGDPQDSAVEALAHMEWLLTTNPTWKHMPIYWHERAKAELIAGNIAEAQQAMVARVEAQREVELRLSNEDRGYNELLSDGKLYFRNIGQYVIQEDVLSPDDILQFTLTICTESRKVMRSEKLGELAIVMLADEADQFLAVLDAHDPAGAERIRNEVEALKKRADTIRTERGW